MKTSEYQKMYDCEDSYWWFVSRRRLADRFMRKHLPQSSYTGACIDMGCGTGVVLEELGTRFAMSVGMDLSPVALGLAHNRKSKTLVRGDVVRAPFADNSFELVLCLDAIEHIPDDLAAIHECYRVCKPGGYAIFSAPALDFLWSEHDVALRHQRRYSPGSLKARITSQGFVVEKIRFAVCCVGMFVLLVRLILAFTRHNMVADTMMPKMPTWINHAVVQFQEMEGALSTHVPLPFGTGLICVARKASETVRES